MVGNRSALGWLNLLTPRDRGVERVADNLVYGPKARHRLDIYAPKDGPEAAPVMVFFYGGGWDSGNREDYAFAGYAFAAMGFVTVIADYRVYPEVLYPDFLNDCARATEWVSRHIKDYGGDGRRLVVGGHSAGAYNAVMVGADRRTFGGFGYHPSVKAVVGLSGPYDFYPFDVEASIRSFGGAGAGEDSQPVCLDLSAAPPMLLVHGLKDETVQPRNSKALAARLSSAGRQVKLVEYAGAGHILTVLTLFPFLRWRLSLFRDIRDFLGSILD